MIEVLYIVLLALVVLLVLFLLKKSLAIFGFFFKLLLILFCIAIVGGIIFGYMVVTDANDFKNNFVNSTSMYVVKYDNNGTTSFLGGVTINPETKKVNPIKKELLTSVESLYKNNSLSTLSPEYYKVFVIELKSFDEVALYNISDQNVELTKEEIKTIMLSSNARQDLASIIAKKQGSKVEKVLKDLASSNEEIKGYLASYYLSTVFNPNNMVQFLTQIKNGNIRVYAESAMFTAIKLIPESLVASALGKQQTTTVNQTL